MRNILLSILIVTLYGCSSNPIQSCKGDSSLPATLAKGFEPTKDNQLRGKALGDPGEGKLCQGQVYESKSDAKFPIILYRAWNSTNPKSKFGNWWTFQKPTGKISTYRFDYELCYQWSPLDKLVKCELKPKMKVVVGTGQSAECSKYLIYGVSGEKQVYIGGDADGDTSESVTNCSVSDSEFSWTVSTN
jgi:hypothetical protein